MWTAVQAVHLDFFLAVVTMIVQLDLVRQISESVALKNQSFHTSKRVYYSSGGQNLERRNVQRLIFRNFKIANIKIAKRELFDNFIFDFNFSYFRNHLNTKNI